MPAQHHYDQVASELRDAEPVAGLWARAFADSGGDMNRARALYIRYRADELEVAEGRITRQKEEKQKIREHAERTVQAKVVGVRVGLVGLMLLGFFLMLVAGSGLLGAVTEKEWGMLVVTAIFGPLGILAIRKARAGWDDLK